MQRADQYRPYRHNDPIGMVLRTLDVGLRRFGIVLSSYRPMTREIRLTAQPERRQEVFDTVFKNNTWLAEETRSGNGSTRSYTTIYRAELASFIHDFNIRSIFDAPCGDINWIGSVIADSGIEYVGGDISQEVVEIARDRDRTLDIRLFDICTDDFPACEVWHCRDCLFHLSFEDIVRAMRRFVASEAKYALLTTHRARLLQNVDIPTGSFRWLDLERAPFHLPSPLRYLKDYRTGLDFPRYVGVWDKARIANALDRMREARSA